MNIALTDLETGGFNKEKNGILEIGIIILNHKLQKIDEYRSLVKPYNREGSDEMVSYKEDAMKVNGYSEQELKELPNDREAKNVGKEVSELLTKYEVKTILGHNSDAFDKPWLNYFLKRFGGGYELKEGIDTMKLSKEKVKGLKSYSLENLSKHFEIKNEKLHTAISDCNATLELYKKLIRI